MLGRRNGNCRSRLGKPGVEAYSGRYLRCSVEKNKEQKKVILEIRTLKGAGISTDDEIEAMPYLRISDRHLR
jgi:hypothetical protein